MPAVRSVLRALAILGCLLYASARYAAGALSLRLRRSPPDERLRWEGDCLFRLLRTLGATFIKVGQILSTRSDLLPPHLIAALERLQDDVGPFPYAIVRQTLTEELGRPPEELFTEFAPTPVASASVAQVHRARLLDGRVVAVKVRRPEIEALCAFDLSAMRLFARALALLPSIRLLAPLETVEEFGRGIRMQLDFTVEAENNRRFQRNFAGDADVVFPTLVEAMCTRRVLVMHFIEGRKIGEARTSAADPKRLAKVGFRVMLQMIFEDGFVHADLHPGNLLVTTEGRLALLDLGLVGELDETHRIAFARYFAAWATGDGGTMAEIMTRYSPSPEILDFDGFRRAVIEFVGRYHGKRLGEVEVAGVILDMMGILRRYRVRANAAFTLVNIAIAVTEGIGKQLDPEVDLMREAAPFFARMRFAGTHSS